MFSFTVSTISSGRMAMYFEFGKEVVSLVSLSRTTVSSLTDFFLSASESWYRSVFEAKSLSVFPLTREISPGSLRFSGRSEYRDFFHRFFFLSD